MEQDEQEVIEEHCSPESGGAANIFLVEIDSDWHQEAATAPPKGIGGSHHDVSFNVQWDEQEVSEEHDHEDSHSLGLANVPPVGSDGEITHTYDNLRRYPRPPHRPPQRYDDYVLH